MTLFWKLGTIVHCEPPASVSARTETCQRIVDVIFGAMAEGLPDRVLAGCNSTLNGINISGVDPRNGEFYVYPDQVRRLADRLEAVVVHLHQLSSEAPEEQDGPES